MTWRGGVTTEEKRKDPMELGKKRLPIGLRPRGKDFKKSRIKRERGTRGSGRLLSLNKKRASPFSR